MLKFYLQKNAYNVQKLISKYFSYRQSSILKSDPELYDLIRGEEKRQRCGLQLVASENFCSLGIMEAVGSCLTNKYANGYPGARNYGNTEFVDKVENLAQQRVLELFRLDPLEWGVNVQPYSGAPANLAVYTAVLQPHERIMGLDLPDGGHVTHGSMAFDKRISGTSIFFETMPYKLDIRTSLIDYDELEKSAILFKPKMIIAVTSAYSRLLDYQRFRNICDKVGAILHADMAHISGLVAAGVIPSPFDYADIVSTTTHKSLRGPRAGMIFYRRQPRLTSKPYSKSAELSWINPRLVDLDSKINNAVYPALQGGPHINTIAGIALMAKEALSQNFIDYATQVLLNAKALCDELKLLNYKIVSDGTDTHLLLVDLRPFNIDGSRVDWICENLGIAVNKTKIPGDKYLSNYGGLRLGTLAMTTRSLKEFDFKKVAQFIDDSVTLSKGVMSQTKSFEEFKEFTLSDSSTLINIKKIRNDVESFVKLFPMPGLEDV